MKLDLDMVLDYSKNHNVCSIYDCFRSEGYSIGESQKLFIEAVRLLIKLGIARLEFRIWVEQKSELDNASIDVQLDFIKNTFPKIHDENIPERDIDNLWWYIGCPVDIEWKQDDGSYFVSG